MQDNLEVWHELGVYMTRFENPEMKVESKSNKLLGEDPDVDGMLEAGREKESVDSKELSPDLINTSWHVVRTKSGQISQPLVCQVDEMGISAAKMNYHALLADLDQEEVENCEVDLVGAGLGGGLNHTLSYMK